jgi:hypothetical protein
MIDDVKTTSETHRPKHGLHASARTKPATASLRWLTALACVLTFALAPVATAQDDLVNREYQLKALFVYNFGTFIEWPEGTFADAKAPFVIGVLGSASADLISTLNQIAASKTIGERKIVIERYKSIDEMKDCQVLFVSRSVPLQQQSKIIETVGSRPILTVGESQNFATNGGDVNFFIDANKIRFEINLEATKQQNLKINARLLAMARIIGENPSTKR